MKKAKCNALSLINITAMGVFIDQRQLLKPSKFGAPK